MRLKCISGPMDGTYVEVEALIPGQTVTVSGPTKSEGQRRVAEVLSASGAETQASHQYTLRVIKGQTYDQLYLAPLNEDEQSILNKLFG